MNENISVLSGHLNRLEAGLTLFFALDGRVSPLSTQEVSKRKRKSKLEVHNRI